VDVAERLLTGAPGTVKRIAVNGDGPGLVPLEELKLRYYLCFTVKDQPGVLARISKVLADGNISIQSVIQIGTADGDYVPLVIMTHEACEGDMQRAMREFCRFDVVKGRVQLIRVEEI
jgi:homoserine dehydrogenase